MVKQIANLDEFQTLLASTPELIVVDFTAVWCPPCQFIGPKFVELSQMEEYAHVTFVKVDVEEADDVAAHEGISAMPTFKFYKGGQKIDEMMGADLAKLTSLLQKHK